MDLKRFVIGDTIRITWINSGVIPSSINTLVYNGSESLIDSGAMVDSGNGHYFYDHTIPNSSGFYVVETNAIIASKPYRRRAKYQAALIQVD